MWSYYGSKSKLVKYYPSPKYNTIIEPFAGAAWYSVTHRKNNVILNEKYDVVYNIWNWLINEAESEEFLEDIVFHRGDRIYNIVPDKRKEYQDLVGFMSYRGGASPFNKIGKWACGSNNNENAEATDIHKRLVEISQKVKEIKHWKVIHGDYRDLHDTEATWYIDPPYQFGGEHYKESADNIDFLELAEWCKSRKGQVIVCENTKADWLPFEPLVKIYGSKKKSTEAIWLNDGFNLFDM